MPLITSSADNDLIEKYTQGECHAFAIAIHRLTGWSLMAILDYEEPFWINPDDGEDIIPSVAHVLCVSPDGDAWDVKGGRPVSEVKTEMEDTYLIMQYGTDYLRSEIELKHYIGCWAEEGDEPIERPLWEFSEDDIAEAIEAVRNLFPELAAVAPSF